MRPMLAILLFASACSAQIQPSKKKQVVTVLEHLALGAGTEIAVSQAAGGAQHWPAGLLATGIVSGFKEGADAVAGRDTKKEAIIHALTIVAGAGISIAAWHTGGRSCMVPWNGGSGPSWQPRGCELR